MPPLEHVAFGTADEFLVICFPFKIPPFRKEFFFPFNMIRTEFRITNQKHSLVCLYGEPFRFHTRGSRRLVGIVSLWETLSRTRWARCLNKLTPAGQHSFWSARESLFWTQGLYHSLKLQSMDFRLHSQSRRPPTQSQLFLFTPSWPVTWKLLSEYVGEADSIPLFSHTWLCFYGLWLSHPQPTSTRNLYCLIRPWWSDLQLRDSPRKRHSVNFPFYW